jgi:hypothetical protein
MNMVTQEISLDKLLFDRGISSILEKVCAPVSVDIEINVKGEENHSPASNTR